MMDAGKIEILSDLPSLSAREIEILRQLAIGKTDKEIGDCFKISAKTVNHHVTHILVKLQANNRAHAVARALMSRLIQLRTTDAVHHDERRQHVTYSAIKE